MRQYLEIFLEYGSKLGKTDFSMTQLLFQYQLRLSSFWEKTDAKKNIKQLCKGFTLKLTSLYDKSLKQILTCTDKIQK